MKNSIKNGCERSDFSIGRYLSWLQTQLSTLPTERQIAYGAWCSERLYSGYKTHAMQMGSNDAIHPILDRIWAHIAGQRMPADEIELHIQTCSQLPIDEATPNWNEAIDAVDAVLLTLEACKHETSTTIAKAAECAINRVDRVINNHLFEREPHLLSPAETSAYLQEAYEHPLFQEELLKQALQLQNLRNAPIATRDSVMAIT